MCFAAAKSKKSQKSYPLSPAAPDAEEVSRFKFDTLSPDDTILEAQKQATGSAEPSAVRGQQQQSGAASQSTGNEDTPSITHGELFDVIALVCHAADSAVMFSQSNKPLFNTLSSCRKYMHAASKRCALPRLSTS